MVRTVNIVFGSNTASSTARVAVEYANALSARGITVHISYPLLCFWDYHRWLVARRGANLPRGIAAVYRWAKFWQYLLRDAMRSVIRARGLRWNGAVLHAVDPRIRFHRCFAVPSPSAVPDADIMLVMQNYLAPRLLWFPASKGRIIGSVHMDYGAAQHDLEPTPQEWWRKFVTIEQHFHIPRFAVSAGAARAAEVLGITVDRVIENGINHAEFVPSPRVASAHAPVRVMVFCGSPFVKGQDVATRAIRILRARLPRDRVHFVSIGSVRGTNHAAYDTNLGYLHGSDYVRAYHDADIFVYPSLQDAFPAPPLEAMACGCPLVTTRVPGVEEYGVDGVNCLVVPPNDAEGIAAAVARLVDDPGLRSSLRAEGLRTARRFTWARSADRLLTFMDDVLAGRVRV